MFIEKDGIAYTDECHLGSGEARIQYLKKKREIMKDEHGVEMVAPDSGRIHPKTQEEIDARTPTESALAAVNENTLWDHKKAAAKEPTRKTARPAHTNVALDEGTLELLYRMGDPNEATDIHLPRTNDGLIRHGTEDIKRVQKWIDVRLDEEAMAFLWDALDTKKSTDAQRTATNEMSMIGARHKLAGNISRSDFLADKDEWFFNTWLKPLTERLFYRNDPKLHYYFNIEKAEPPPKFYMNKFWANYQKQHEFNPLHNHADDAMYAFVVFMKIPYHWKEQHMLPHSVGTNSPYASNFEFIWGVEGTNGGIGRYTVKLSPEDEGRMLFFPSWLSHQVYPFYNCEEDRITISGNVMINFADEKDPQPQMTYGGISILDDQGNLEDGNKMLMQTCSEEQMKNLVDLIAESGPNNSAVRTFLHEDDPALKGENKEWNEAPAEGLVTVKKKVKNDPKHFFPVVVDNFFDDPEQIAKWGKSLPKETDPIRDLPDDVCTQVIWPGKRSKHISEIDKTLNDLIIKKILNCYYDLEYVDITWNYAEMRFQEIPRFSENKNDVRNKGWLHQDSLGAIREDATGYGDGYFHLAGLIYLTQNIDPDTGTSLYNMKDGISRHEVIKKMEGQRIINNALLKHGHFDREEYTKSFENHEENFFEKVRFQNIFNRLIMYDTTEWHRANNYYTDDGEDDRLTLAFFIGGLNIYPIKRIRNNEYESLIKSRIEKKSKTESNIKVKPRERLTLK